MKIKRWISVLLCMLLCVGMIPTTELAASPITLYVNGTNILNEADNTVACGEGTAVYDKATNTLTLTNATIEGDFDGSAAIYSHGDVTIRLVGTNTITSGYFGVIAQNNGVLTIGGSGTLIIASDNDCLRATDIVIGIVGEDDAPVIKATARQDNTGLYAVKTLTIQNDADVTVNSNGTAICSEKGIQIVDSSVFATANGDGVNTIASYGDISINNSEVEAKGTSSTAYPALFADGDISIDNQSKLTAESAGMRGIYTENSMTVTDSTVTASGATDEGIIVVDTFSINNSKVIASGSKLNDIIPAIVTYHLNITASDVTAKGGIQLWDFHSGDTTGRSFSITPASGKLAEFKVDGTNWDGSGALHFKEGQESPYDAAVTFTESEMNWLDAYRYVHIGEHIHSGGTATCTEKAVCADCGRTYGELDPNTHTNIHVEAKEPTYTEEGNVEYWKCSGCGKYFSDAAGTQEISYEDTIIPKLQGSTTIYYALHFDTNGGENMNSVVKESGTVMDLSEYVPVREGYTFTGWYADEELTQPVAEVTLDNTKTIYAGWEEIVTDTRLDQEISMTNPYQERDLANGSRNTMSKVCTLKLGFAVEDPNLSLAYETSDPEVATVKDGKITYQGVGECMITVTAAATDLCKEAKLEIPVKVGSLGTPTFTPSVTSRTAKKAFVATSSTVRGVDGWEVQYSIRKDFWRPRTKDFPDAGAKLYRVTCPTMWSNRTYYIHVRGYQIIDGKKVYSDWSPVKTIRTK